MAPGQACTGMGGARAIQSVLTTSDCPQRLTNRFAIGPFPAAIPTTSDRFGNCFGNRV